MINHPIRSDEEHAQALREIDGLMSAEAGTAEGARLDQLVTLVECYEAKRWPISALPEEDNSTPRP